MQKILKFRGLTSNYYSLHISHNMEYNYKFNFSGLHRYKYLIKINCDISEFQKKKLKKQCGELH